MEAHLHEDKLMDEAESLHGSKSELSLLDVLTETLQRLGAVRRCRDRHDGTVGGRRGTGVEAGSGGGEEAQRGSEGGMLSPEETRGLADEESECEQRVLGLLRELSVFHSDRVTAWRAVLRGCAHRSPPGGSDEQHPSTTDTQCNVTPLSDSFGGTFLSVGENVENILDQLNAIVAKLDEEILGPSAEEASTVDAALRETRDPEAPEQPGDDDNRLNSREPLESDSGRKQADEDGDGDDQRHTMSSPGAERASDSRFGSSACNDEEEEAEGEVPVNSRGGEHEDCASPGSETDFREETGKDTNRVNKEWITVGLSGQQEESYSDVQDTCFIRAPKGAAGALICEVADTLSCLMVTGSEELVSRVIRVNVRDGANVHFPVTVVVPFCARYRGNYRDVAVKIVDGERRASYVTPVTTEGTYGGHRGSFAEVRVYSLGLFAVVSCLKKENYTVPTKGLLLKLHMDQRICLNYPPGCFTAPVMAQTMIQPVDAVLLAAVKSRSDAYHSVVSTSPLLCLTQPSSQPLRRPLALTLPCPPNPEKKRPTRGQEEEQDHQTRPFSASSHRRRVLGASVKSKKMSNELLIVLGSRDQQWRVLDQVPVRNQQNGLVSFELTENFDRLLVVRLLSPLQPGRLASLAEELEESVCCHAVTVVLQRRQEEPHAALVAALPSRDLGWEMSRLRARGYSGLLEAASEISMREGDQLLLRFSGNITSTGAPIDLHGLPRERLTFHNQQTNRLSVRLTEVDPFGNYSSPHYKGTAVFHKVGRGQLEWRGDGAVPMDAKLLGDPVCKLSLTLPKRVRNINRPITVRVKLCEETDPLSDSLLLWLSGELSEEEVALLVLSLRLRRSAAQLVKLRAGDSLPSQAFRVLTMWRRGLPAATHQPKASQLAHCLAKSGRPDLARELLLRQAAPTRRGSPK
ncbi:death domain-containing protein 1 [Cyclopterus lumpus]|uniref:death domain-containing protein 1 n=1 Tax=Cyclopterus lumpus TaxID=8103 RepID=UPI001485F049|nr:death domain-containing protein 1 [Cyclopterus lumpus]XP_034413496.1 death domain-containing protein 1 [Cyclopterus lumpus]